MPTGIYKRIKGINYFPEKVGFQKGYKQTEAHKTKISEAHKGKKGFWKATKQQKQKMSKSRLGKYRGNKCPSWKGGITILQRRIRTCFKYRQWRSDVFTRDDFTCQECGKRGCWIESHHIKRFSDIIEEYQIKTLEEAEKCEELWNINNGRTLCKECHKK